MLSEEKEALEILKLYFGEEPTLNITKYVNIVLNLIEKQQKEIEELKAISEYREKIIYWLDRLDLEEELQNEYDELYGCQAAIKILKQLLKGE